MRRAGLVNNKRMEIWDWVKKNIFGALTGDLTKIGKLRVVVAGVGIVAAVIAAVFYVNLWAAPEKSAEVERFVIPLGYSNEQAAAKLKEEAIKRGLILLSCGTYGNVIRFLVPLTASDELVREGMDLFAKSLSEAVA